jgi:hypothetical protein
MVSEVEAEGNVGETIPVGIRVAIGTGVAIGIGVATVRPSAIGSIRSYHDSIKPKAAVKAIEVPAHYVAVADDTHGDLHRAAVVHGRDRVLADR